VERSCPIAEKDDIEKFVKMIIGKGKPSTIIIIEAIGIIDLGN